MWAGDARTNDSPLLWTRRTTQFSSCHTEKENCLHTIIELNFVFMYRRPRFDHSQKQGLTIIYATNLLHPSGHASEVRDMVANYSNSGRTIETL